MDYMNITADIILDVYLQNGWKQILTIWPQFETHSELCKSIKFLNKTINRKVSLIINN